MDRIILGTSSSPEPTIVNLAIEAGVGRATVNRYEDLKALFAEKIEAAISGKEVAVNPALRVGQLEKHVRELKGRVSGLRQENERMGQQLLDLTETHRRLVATVKQKDARIASLSGVTSIESRRRPVPRA